MKLDRLVSILVVLLRRERIQARELAEMFDVSVRTILRDVDAINLAGIPIVTYQGVNGGIGIAEGYRLDKSVLTGDDMAAIISTLKGIACTVDDSRHEVLMEKLKNTLNSKQLELLNTKLNRFVIDLNPWGGSGVLKEKLAAIRRAIEAFRLLEFDYTDSNGRRTSRRVEPYSLVLKGEKWYLYAWCRLRSGFRYFRLGRIKELAVLDEPFEPREIEPEMISIDDDWYRDDNIVSLELVFEAEKENIICEWFGEENIEHINEKLLVRLALPENDWLYGFLLSFGTGLEVVNPPHIRRILADMAYEVYKKYSIQT